MHLHDLFESQKANRRRRALRLPESAQSIFQSSLQRLFAAKASRAWTLPESDFPVELQHYYDRHRVLAHKGPVPRLRKSVEPMIARELSIKIDAALNFAELARNADPLVKPILLYYSCAHLCGVYTRAFLEWERDSRGHGLSCKHNAQDPAKTVISIEQSGQFPRLCVACFVFTGRPGVFTPLVVYSGKPTAHTGPGELLERFGTIELGEPIESLSVSELATFDFCGQLKGVRTRHGLHKNKGLPTSAFLLDVITLFVASSLARYDVLGWKRILDGNDNSLRILFEETYERYLETCIDVLLASIEDPLGDFDRRQIPSRPSPYSHDDHFRFQRDPDAS